MGSYTNAEDVRAVARRLQDLQGDERPQAVTQATITGLFKVRGHPGWYWLPSTCCRPGRRRQPSSISSGHCRNATLT